MADDTPIPSGADAARQLAAGFRWLRFAPGLESAFREHWREEGLAQLRLVLVLGVGFGIAFVVLDWLLGAPGFSNDQVLLRFALNQSLCIVMLAATFVHRLHRHLGWLGSLVALNLGLSSLFITTIAESRNVSTPFVALIVLTFYTYLFLGMRFWRALATATMIYVATMAACVAAAAPIGVVLYNGLFALFANMIGATGLYNIEYSKRASFLKAREMEKLAGTDPLTGLANRGTFTRHLDRTWRHCQRSGEALTVGMVDVDAFKKYNDLYGHQAGDRCLQRIAALVAEICSRPLDLAARYGGEEFVLVLPGCSLAHARERLQNLRHAIEDLEITHGASAIAPVVTISAGLAQVFPAETRHSPDGLLQMADEALYSAKLGGRNRVIVTAENQDMRTGYFNPAAHRAIG